MERKRGGELVKTSMGDGDVMRDGFETGKQHDDDKEGVAFQYMYA